MSRISFEVHDELVPISDQQWSVLFAGHPDSVEMIRLMECSGLPGFRFSSIVGKIGTQPVLLMPLFETEYSLSSTLEGGIRDVAAKIENVCPWLLKQRVIGVGFVEGEWGQIGLDPSLSQDVAKRALAEAMDVLRNLAGQRKAQIIAIKDFAQPANMANCAPDVQQLGRTLPAALVSKFSIATSLPFCRLHTNFRTFDEYLNSIPRKVRQDLRRKMRQSEDVTIKHTKAPDEWMNRIYELYLDQVHRSDLSFGVHNRYYFERICDEVPGAEYILFFYDDVLIGFNLVVQHGDLLIDKYVGMDAEAGRAHNLYFVAWLEKIRYAIANKLPMVHLGAAAEGVKVRMGAFTVDSYVMFHHRNPVANFVLSKLTGLLSYKPEVLSDDTSTEASEEPSAVGAVH